MERDMRHFDCAVFMSGVRRKAGERGERLPDRRALFALLRLQGEDFVMAAYRSILNREADRAGLRAYTHRARHFVGRALILLSLCLSPERTHPPAFLRRALASARWVARLARKENR